jgi:hypothetical protein
VQWHSAARGHEWLLSPSNFHAPFLCGTKSALLLRTRPHIHLCHSLTFLSHSLLHSVACAPSPCSFRLSFHLIPPASPLQGLLQHWASSSTLAPQWSCPVTRRRAEKPRLAHPSRVSHWLIYWHPFQADKRCKHILHCISSGWSIVESNNSNVFPLFE